MNDGNDKRTGYIQRMGTGEAKSVNEAIPVADAIASVSVPACYLCGVEGTPLYVGLSDQWCGAPGSWNLARCPNPECGLVWLNPMPAREEIGKAYRGYFTHQVGPVEEKRRIDGMSLLLIKIFKPWFKLLSHATGARRFEKRWRKRADAFYLDAPVSGARLLDVGCGNGDLLARMRDQGWVVEGVEVDAEAVKAARAKHGLTVHCGALEDLHFPGDSFHAITMNHVIEHVHDPVSLLGECRRVLKAGGRLVVVTPNINGLGHRRFRRNWFGFTPPRHLYLFSRNTLRELALKAGFRSFAISGVPGVQDGIFQASLDLEQFAAGAKPREFLKWVKASCLKIHGLFLVRGDEDVGEEIVLSAEKEG